MINPEQQNQLADALAGISRVLAELAAALHEDRAAAEADTEELPRCQQCGNPSNALEMVEDRDDSVGYHADSMMCPDCIAAMRRRS